MRRIHKPRIGGCLAHLGRATRSLADQPRSDVAAHKCGRSGHGCDGADGEEQDRRHEVERSTRGDGIGLVEEEEHGDVGERRAMDARPPDAVEQEHQEEHDTTG
jgi:hypothetical protein